MAREIKKHLSATGIFRTLGIMAKTVAKKTTFLQPRPAREPQEQTDAQQKTVSGPVQQVPWKTRRGRLRKQFYQLENYWNQKAKEQGIICERDLKRHLNR